VVSGAAALAGVGVPLRTSSSPDTILTSSADLAGLGDASTRIVVFGGEDGGPEGDRGTGEDATAFDAVAEIAARDAEAPRQDTAVKALCAAFDESERQRLSKDAELRALRSQYDHLALRADPGEGVINVDNIGFGHKIFIVTDAAGDSSSTPLCPSSLGGTGSPVPSEGLPGPHFRLPPVRFIVKPHHFWRHKVEPLTNHCLVLRAVVLNSFSGDLLSAGPAF
jgi:hypothetical protein